MAARRPDDTPSQRRDTPDMATQDTGGAHPFIDATPPFYLVFHPERWTVVAGQLVPALSKVNLVAGVNGVEIDRQGKIRFAKMRAQIEEEGRTLVPWNWAPDGSSYLQCIETRPANSKEVQEAWITKFESVDIGGTETSSDDEAYAAWLTDLVKTGKLPTCSANVARRMLGKARERFERARADAAKLGGAGAASLRANALEAEVMALKKHVDSAKGTAVKAVAKQGPGPKMEDQP